MPTIIVYSKTYQVGQTVTVSNGNGKPVQGQVISEIYNPQPIQGPNGPEIRNMGRNYYNVQIPDTK